MPARSSIRFGRIAGVEIGASWSWLVIVTLLLLILAGSVFPSTNPDLSDGTYVAMAAAAAVLFFVSLTAHELGHAVQAQREGMEIEGITLWVLGGVARFKGMFPSAGAELRIALAGPAVSLVIGAAFIGAALATNLPSAVDGVLFWVGQINLILLAFNMLPALPLDGGRALRAILWHRRGDFAAATRTAAGLGRGFGQFLVAFGLVSVLLTGAFGGLWLAIIGLFLVGAADAEGQFAQTRDALGALTVGDIMITEPVTVGDGLPLDRFLDEIFLTRRHTAYPVTDDHGRAVGIVSFRQAAAAPRDEWSRRRVADVMTVVQDAATMKPEDPLQDAFLTLVQDDLHRALVMDDDRVVGLLSLTDVARLVEVSGELGGRPLTPPDVTARL